MNKGRNVLIVFAVLLVISFLAFLTMFERNNTSGVVDDVRYILESDDDTGRVYSFYFVSGDPTTATAYEADGEWTLIFDGDENYQYVINATTGDIVAYLDGEEAGSEAFSLYTEKLFKNMFVKQDRFLKFYQAAIVFVIVLAGGAIILYAEEIWHIVNRKGEDVIPAWSDMTPVKIVGGCVIGAGAVLLLLFILL